MLLPPLRPHFHAALRDVTARSPAARAAAAEVLGAPPEGQEEDARVALRTLIDDADPTVRGAALASAGRLRDAGALASILARFDDGDPAVAQIAIIAAGDIGGDDVVRALRRALRSDSPAVRFQAVAALSQLRPDGVATSLARLTDDPDAMVREQLADALGALETTDARSALRRLLDDEATAVKRSAAIALARIGDATGRAVLIDSLDDRERFFEAAWALGELGIEEAVEPLFRKSRGLLTSLTVKAAAGAALVRLGDARGEEILRQVLRAVRHDARSYAVGMVAELGLVSLADEVARLADRPRGADPVAVAKALAALAPESEVAQAALETVARRDDEASEVAREALRDSQNRAR